VNLDAWSKLVSGDLLQYVDRPDSPIFRLLKPIHRDYPDPWQTWPIAWTWVPVDPALRAKGGTPAFISSDQRDFWARVTESARAES